MAAVNSSELDRVVSVMSSFQRPWFIAGGWALDLAGGSVTRDHHDVDICVFREDVEPLLLFFEGWVRKVAVPGEQRLVPCFGKDDVQPPRHELHLMKDDLEIEILLIDKRDDRVLFRRDPSIWMPYAKFARQDGCRRPYVAPEWQLLFKAKNPRPKDDHDFLTHAPQLSMSAKQWLLAALQVHLPTSPWIKRLEAMML